MNQNYNNSEFRHPTELERAIFEKLLSSYFLGAEELRLQLSGMKVKEIDADGSLKVLVKNKIPTKTDLHFRVPVEASYYDTDKREPLTPRVRILLHVIDGIIDELEIYKDDSTSVERLPNIAELIVDVWEEPETKLSL